MFEVGGGGGGGGGEIKGPSELFPKGGGVYYLRQKDEKSIKIS